MHTVIPAIRALNFGSHAMFALPIAFHGYKLSCRLNRIEHYFADGGIWKKGTRRELDGDVMADGTLVTVGSPLTLASALSPALVCLHAVVLIQSIAVHTRS